jgi:hypothetical protein
VLEIWRRILSNYLYELTDLRFAAESDEKESQCLINRIAVEVLSCVEATVGQELILERRPIYVFFKNSASE